MKKTVCLILAVVMALSALALAEEWFKPLDEAADTETNLERMIPVLDSLARSLNIESADPAGRVAYDAEDAGLVWNQLRLMSANWLAKDPALQTMTGVRVPAHMINTCASASFGGMVAPLPEMPEDIDAGTVTYNAEDDTYLVWAEEDETPSWIVVESYAEDEDAVVVNCGLYRGEEGRRVGGLTARMEPMVDAEPAEDDAKTVAFPYMVIEAHPENPADFNGLRLNLCNIRYVAPVEGVIATATPEPTEAAPTATPAPTSGGNGTTYKTLSKGSKGNAVKKLQERLNKLGYNCGKADGVFGDGTAAAVRLFQEMLGEKQDGIATPSLQKKLFASSAPAYNPYATLKKGSSGTRVVKLQNRLRELGYTDAPADGSYGDRLEAAVKLFQQMAGLKAVDGVAGEETLKALEKKDAPTYPGLIELRKGDSGSHVLSMTTDLVRLGMMTAASSSYDAATVAGVKAFLAYVGESGDGTVASAELISRMHQSDPPKPDPDEPDPDTPDPDTPDPDTPDPDTPDPDTPDPVQPDPDTPDPVQPDPDTPDPVQPDPDTPDPVQPDPVQPDPVQPDPVQPDPVQPDPVQPDPIEGE